MNIEIKEVTTKGDLKNFIHAPWKLHKGHELWAPPLLMDEWTFFSPKKNRNFAHSDTIMLLAYKGSEISGRVMGIVNNKYNKEAGETTARFGYLEADDDMATVRALLERVETWAKGLGMNKIVGPMGFTDQDPEGFIVEGFEGEPTIATYYNWHYIPKHVESHGYTKEVDYFSYQIDATKPYPSIYDKVIERSKKNGYRLIEFKSTKQMKPLIIPILSLMNDAFAPHIYGYVRLEEKEMHDLANRYLPVLDPRFVKVCMKEDEVVGFIIAIPNMDSGFRKANGKLLPFGILHLMNAAKKTKQLDLLLGAIKDTERGRGVDAIMGKAMHDSARNAGMTVIDSHVELESNVKVRAEMERAGGKVFRRYRIFKKPL
jgi:predicted GNAT family acetyltransferase